MTESFPSASDPLTTATQLVKTGRLEQAKEVLSKFLMNNPSSEQGWLLMSFVLSDAAQQKDCLERVLRINPNNTVAQSRLAHLLGKRTEELFLGKNRSPSAQATKTESPADRKSVSPVLSVLPSSDAGIEKSRPAGKQKASVEGLEPPSETGRKSNSSGRWFRIVSIILIIVILGVIGTILYVGLVGPAISHLSITATPTTQAIVMPTLPPAWTSTLTPTETLKPTPTSTPTITLTAPPSLTPINSKTATKKT